MHGDAGKNPLLKAAAAFPAPPKGAILRALAGAGIAQTAERLIRNQQVGGSSPPSGTNKINRLLVF